MRALLIQKSIKPTNGNLKINGKFESFVNSEEYQTGLLIDIPCSPFESFVNSEEYQTKPVLPTVKEMFESFVNSEEYQTKIF